jgi:hypothetical protein
MELTIGRSDILTASIRQSGAIFDLTGYVARLAIVSKSGATPVLNKVGVISDPATGNIDFTIEAADLLSVAAGHYRCEVNIWKSSTPSILYTPIKDSVEIVAGLVAQPAG